MSVLDGKSVIVTGSGRGLGRAYATAMAKEGARLVINDIDVAEAEKTAADIKALGGTAVANTDDVASWDGARHLVEQCVKDFGGIDVLVNNAGVLYAVPFTEATEEQINVTLAVNLKGTLNVARHAVDHMVPRRSGCIINVSSGSQSGLLLRAVYGASKGGVSSFTYNLAMELAPYNIRVNAISPLAHTRMWDAPEARRFPADKVAPVVVFLASDDASYVTGQVVRLEGDTLGLFSHPEPVHPVILKSGWTLEDLRKYFRGTLGRRLQPVGLRAKGYEYYQGMGKGQPPS